METLFLAKTEEGTISYKIMKNGWRQGSCLLIGKDHPLFKDHQLEKCGLYIIITQNCDLLHDDLQIEPRVELLYAEKLLRDEGLVGGKSSRKIHISIKFQDTEINNECSILNRFFIPRNYLTQIYPSQYFISPKTLAALVSWLVKRYNRTAFPNEFVKRLDKKR